MVGVQRVDAAGVAEADERAGGGSEVDAHAAAVSPASPVIAPDVAGRPRPVLVEADQSAVGGEADDAEAVLALAGARDLARALEPSADAGALPPRVKMVAAATVVVTNFLRLGMGASRALAPGGPR